MKKEKKFRTMYETLGFDDSTKPLGKSMTDPSGYEPIEEKVNKFLRGEMPRASGEVGYDINSPDIDDDTAFDRFAIDKTIQEDLANFGEEALANELKKVRVRLERSKAKANVKKPDEPIDKKVDEKPTDK